MLSLGRSSGWWFGTAAAVFGFVYFIFLGSLPLAGLEVCFILLLIYGLLNQTRSIKMSKLLYVALICFLVTLYFLQKEASILELYIVVSFVLAVYFLADQKHILGWTIMLTAHISMAIFTFEKEQYIFSIFQVLSFFIALKTILKPYSKPNS
ncbi:MAG: hypothetical protein ACRCVT_09520 [Leadbetterella sp.]